MKKTDDNRQFKVQLNTFEEVSIIVFISRGQDPHVRGSEKILLNENPFLYNIAYRINFYRYE